ncbi:hypothetical protein SAMN05444921_1135 [Streptomyces wuyuanensis]|uniref:Uncharacterized protein n=1 Tax=Streptomyces wuyuanensis TaxID=1196353 RepID=A0A1G9VVA6_9ACTN|nr:hypothetical protein SAMN05444921_1135 [Streptomyces wuyuanensis]
MCVLVRFSTHEPHPVWDARSLILTVPDGLIPSLTAIAVRAVLEQLGIAQPQFGARCWCGESVDLTPRVPEQRRSGQVIRNGA